MSVPRQYYVTVHSLFRHTMPEQAGAPYGVRTAAPIAFRIIPMDQLTLNPVVGSEFIIAGDQIEFALNLVNLTCPMNAIQTMMRYDTEFLELVEFTMNDDPDLGFMLISNSDDNGKLVYAIVTPGAVWRDCRIATLRFNGTRTGRGGMAFRPDEPPFCNMFAPAADAPQVYANLVCQPLDPVSTTTPNITDIRMRPDYANGVQGGFRIQVDTRMSWSTLEVRAVSNQEGAQAGVATFDGEYPSGTLNYVLEDPSYGSAKSTGQS